MNIIPEEIYHIYNQGNNKVDVFLDREDYLTFLNKVREHIKSNCNILGYCLMPNHFHFLIEATETSGEMIPMGNIDVSKLGNAFRLLLSQYAQSHNKKYAQSGSLFRQKTKAKNLSESSKFNLPFICFQYIHQNPLRAHLVKRMEDWEYSSFRDYCGLRNGTLVNKEIGLTFVGFDENNFIEESYVVISETRIDSLY